MNENYWSSRWSKDQLKTVLIGQFNSFWERDTGLERTQLAEVKRAVRAPHTVIISGFRRVGKTTLLAQMAHKLGKEAFYYVNFEDDRFLGFQPITLTTFIRLWLKPSANAGTFFLMKFRISPGGSSLSDALWTWVSNSIWPAPMLPCSAENWALI